MGSTAPKRQKKLNKSNEDCQHEFTFIKELEGETYSLTQKLFDGLGEPITDCDLENIAQRNPINYAIEQDIIITGENYKLDYSQYSNISVSLKSSISSATYSESTNSDVQVYLQIGKTNFNFLEGSYVNMKRSFTASSQNEFDSLIEETQPEIDLKYILGLDANGNDYHFDLTLNNEDLSQSKIEKEYNLLNSSNKKVGTVKYTVYSSGTERFELYDLDGNLVE